MGSLLYHKPACAVSPLSLQSPFLVIGIAGVTNAGKTTVAGRLLQEFPGSGIIHQDSYFRAQDDPLHEHVLELDHHNWDTFSAVNFDKMLEDVMIKIEEMKSSFASESVHSIRLLIVEGILVLNVSHLSRLMNRMYMITLPKDECRRRRLTRNYDPPDVPGYFDVVVWPMYEKYAAELNGRTTIRYYDGRSPTEETVKAISEDIRNTCG